MTSLHDARYRAVLARDAGAGLALYRALPGKENDIAPLALGIIDELSISDNPPTSAVATEAHDLASSLIRQEETRQQAGPIIEAVLRTVAQSDGSPRSIQEAGSLGQKWIEEVNALELSSEQKQELALPYFETIAEELDSPVTGFGAAWVRSIEEENFEARSAIMSQVLKTASEHPNAGPTAVFTAAQEVAKDNPELRHTVLGGFLEQLGEEVGQPELTEYREQAFSAESLSRMESEVERLSRQFAD